MNLLLLGKMEFSKCIENVGTAQTQKWFSLKSCPCSLKGTQLPGRSERSRGTKCQNWGSGRGITAEIEFQGQLWGTSCRNTSGFPPAQPSSLLPEKAIRWFIACPDYWARLGVTINVVRGGMSEGQSSVRTGHTTRECNENTEFKQSSNWEIISSSPLCALCISHSSISTGFSHEGCKANVMRTWL